MHVCRKCIPVKAFLSPFETFPFACRCTYSLCEWYVLVITHSGSGVCLCLCVLVSGVCLCLCVFVSGVFLCLCVFVSGVCLCLCVFVNGVGLCVFVSGVFVIITAGVVYKIYFNCTSMHGSLTQTSMCCCEGGSSSHVFFPSVCVCVCVCVPLEDRRMLRREGRVPE